MQHEMLLYSPSTASIICSSWPVPSVATTSACVSPRVNSAEPWARGRTPTSHDDRAHGLGVAAVDALAGIEDVVADDVRFEFLEQALGGLGVQAFLGQLGVGGFLGRADLLLAYLLHRLGIGGAQVVAGQRRRRGRCSVLVSSESSGSVPRILRRVFGEFDDRLDHRLDRRVTESDGAEHDFLGKLGGFRFHHQHAFVGAGDHEVELARFTLGGRRVQHILRRRYSRRGRRQPGRRRECRRW